MFFEAKNATEKKIVELEKQIQDSQEKLYALHRERESQNVNNYSFSSREGKISLTDLFGPHQELILIHNMGTTCPYCTLWADGINGMIKHFESRAALVVCSDDSVETQSQFAVSRGWKFKMISAADSTFTKDMNFIHSKGYHTPGVSIFKKDLAVKLTRTTRAGFGPGDAFCSLWSFFELLPKGYNGWKPKFNY